MNNSSGEMHDAHISRLTARKPRPANYDIRVQQLVMQARCAAEAKHGPLKGGMERWAHHLAEECNEAIVEMGGVAQQVAGARAKLLLELLQVAQLAEAMVGLLLDDKEWEEAETWNASQS